MRWFFLSFFALLKISARAVEIFSKRNENLDAQLAWEHSSGKEEVRHWTMNANENEWINQMVLASVWLSFHFFFTLIFSFCFICYGFRAIDKNECNWEFNFVKMKINENWAFGK